MRQTAQFYPRVLEKDRYGKEVWRSPSDVKVRWQSVTKTRMQPNGEVTQINGVVMAGPDSDPTPFLDQRIDFRGATYRVTSYNERVNGRGEVNHYTLEVALWEA